MYVLCKLEGVLKILDVKDETRLHDSLPFSIQIRALINGLKGLGPNDITHMRTFGPFVKRTPTPATDSISEHTRKQRAVLHRDSCQNERHELEGVAAKIYCEKRKDLHGLMSRQDINLGRLYDAKVRISEDDDPLSRLQKLRIVNSKMRQVQEYFIKALGGVGRHPTLKKEDLSCNFEEQERWNLPEWWVDEDDLPVYKM